MNRPALFALGIAAGIILLIFAIVYFLGGTGLGHHIKHAILFLGLAVVAFLFAAVMRPGARANTP